MKQENKDRIYYFFMFLLFGAFILLIIIGIIILLSVALVLYLRQEQIIFKPKAPVIPTEAAPIQKFIEACVTQIGEEAVDIIGTTGGYIEIPDEIAQDPMSYIKISSLERGKIPFWRYQGNLRIPPEEFIRKFMVCDKQ